MHRLHMYLLSIRCMYQTPSRNQQPRADDTMILLLDAHHHEGSTSAAYGNDAALDARSVFLGRRISVTQIFRIIVQVLFV